MTRPGSPRDVADIIFAYVSATPAKSCPSLQFTHDQCFLHCLGHGGQNCESDRHGSPIEELIFS